MLTRPTKFGPYLLLERVSLGGMAEVFKAIEFGVEGFERTVAVKRILPHVAEDEEFIAMFKDEARIAVQLQHANIAQIYHLGHEADSFYIALEYVGGRDLRAIFEGCRKQNKPVPIPQVCFIMMQVCEGLDYAHNKKDPQGNALNIIHRDVSPPNILVSYEGSVKLCDFGVAKAAGRVSQTQAGILKGKFGYMSPEQVRGRELDRRSDVFAAGVCLWELLTGKRLFHGDTDFSTLEKVRSGTVERPRTIVDTIPEELEEIVMEALAAEPEDRFSTAAELYDRLRSFLLSKYRDFSRKDLASWMREQYSERIEEEKARDRSRRTDIERFKRGEFESGPTELGVGANPEQELPPLPRIPQVGSGALSSSGEVSGPVIGGGRAATGSVKRAPPKPRGRAKTLLNTTLPSGSAAPTQPQVPSVGQGLGQGLGQSMGQSLGKSSQASAGLSADPEASTSREGMGWDDDELETRLFEDAGSLSMLAPDRTRPDAAPGQKAKEEPLARAMRLSKEGGGEQSEDPGQGASPSPEDSLGAAVGGASQSGTRNRFRNAAASMTGARPPVAGASMSQIGELDFQRNDRRKLWMILGGVGVAVAISLVWGLSSSEPEPAPEVAQESANPVAEQAPAPKTGVSIKVFPGDARVTLDGAELCCGEERVADRLTPGTHKLRVDAGAGFFPASQEVTVVQGQLTPVEVSLSARRVKLEINPEPARAGVFLVEDGQPRRIGRGKTVYELKRKADQSYLIKVSAPGFDSQEIPVPSSAESSQRFDVILAPRGRRGATRSVGAGAAAPATGSSSAQGSAQLKIGAKLGLPPARVFVNGKEVGRTPINLDVAPGRHRVEWRWSDQRTTKTVTVQSGDAKTVLGSN